MPKFILVRHGETIDNNSRRVQDWQGSELTDAGHTQAKEVAKKISQTPDLIFSSDLHRCLQTAEYIHEEYKGVPLLTDWRLRERSFGSHEGMPLDDIDWDEFWSRPETESYKGAEPIAFFAERLKSFVRDTHIFDVETILVVTHGGVLNRFGYVFKDGYEHHAYPNTAVVEYDINYDDPKLELKHAITWRPTNG